MPNWVTNELSVAGPKGAVEVLDRELWSPEEAAGEHGAGFRFHVAVPAVPAGSNLCPSYPEGDHGTNAWGCRAVGAAMPHERCVVTSIKEWVDAHRSGFYLRALDDVAYGRLRREEWETPIEEAISRTMTENEKPMLIRYRFDTAYGAPLRFAAQLAQRYPHLYIRVLWEGECAHVHGMVVHAPTKYEWRADARAVMSPEALLEPLTAMKVQQRKETSVAVA